MLGPIGLSFGAHLHSFAKHFAFHKVTKAQNTFSKGFHFSPRQVKHTTNDFPFELEVERVIELRKQSKSFFGGHEYSF